MQLLSDGEFFVFTDAVAAEGLKSWAVLEKMLLNSFGVFSWQESEESEVIIEDVKRVWIIMMLTFDWTRLQL